MRRPFALVFSPAIVFFFFLAAVAVATTVSAQGNCVDCHSALDDEALSHPALAMSNDVHAMAGLICVDCHGGDANVAIVGDDDSPAKAPGTRFIGAPTVAEIPEFCGRCHADANFMQVFNPDLPVDQLAEYSTSGHGTRLQDGALDVAQCVSCHGSHGMLSPADPEAPIYPTNMADTCGTCHADDDYMIESDLDTDQVELYRESVHAAALYDGGDLSAPTCHTCHGNHGDFPSEVSSLIDVCGNCHAVQGDLFAQGPHKEKFAEVGDPDCVACHSNHNIRPVTDDYLGVEEEQVCSNCHREDDEAWGVALALRADLEDLKTKLEHATETVEGAAFAGMEMSDAELALIDANQSLLMARNVVHRVSVDALREQTDEGRSRAEEARLMGVAAFEELQVRRLGLGISVIFILLVVLGLYMKIRQIESPTRD